VAIAKALIINPRLRLNKILKHFKISRSSYYRFLSRPLRDDDYEDYLLIKKFFDKRKGRAGIRQLKMLIERESGCILNHKKIARIKKKYGLETKIRRKNRHKFFAKKHHEHKSAKNILSQEFNVSRPHKVYSTDITQLNYGRGKKAYLAAFKDLCTKEIVSQEVSSRIDLRLTNSAADKALEKLTKGQKEELIVHSDQGLHFTHISFRNRLKNNRVTQSMSRRGNCLDNAPIESFFGLLKDHLDLKACENLEDVTKMVTREIRYYNNKRPQLGLKKMPPTEYRRHLVG
jgi:transposase InsO family protein